LDEHAGYRRPDRLNNCDDGVTIRAHQYATSGERSWLPPKKGQWLPDRRPVHANCWTWWPATTPATTEHDRPAQRGLNPACQENP
jgi:hypothetical protein